MPDIFTVKEVQDYFRIGRNSIYKLLGSNQIQSVRVRNKYIIPKQSILDFLNISSYNDTSTSNNEVCNVVSLKAEVTQ